MADGDIRAFSASKAERPVVSARDVRLASLGLLQKDAQFSCSNKLRHASALIAFAVLAGVVGLFQPLLLIVAANIFILLIFSVLIAMRAVLVLIGLGVRMGRTPAPVSPEEGPLPRYSVMVPLYKEGTSVARLVGDLRALDYPRDLLEVLFLVEEDDAETQAALAEETLPGHWPVLVLPHGEPRTKPRALNVALARMTGTFATIHDAEDTPHPSQLRAAVKAFRAGSETLACVQAPLRAHNASQSWIAGQWGLEYEAHFGLILPALARVGLPIALGGTSNHFRVLALKAAGGWDAWNVTEDADLGLRLARMGYGVTTITLPTLEEAPESLPVWVPQRSRWIKGYMQSFAVLMRRPGQAIADMGLRGFVASQVLLGGAILSALVHGPVMLICAALLISPELGFGAHNWVLLTAGGLVCVGTGLVAPGTYGWRRVWLVATLPFYLPLLSIGAARAVYELARAPHLWSKTPHGLTKARAYPGERALA